MNSAIFLYRYVRALGEDKWLNSIILLLCNMKKHGIKAVCIFDGPNAPPEKELERKKRRSDNERITNRIQKIEIMISTLEDMNINDEVPSSSQIQEIKVLSNRHRLASHKDGINYKDVKCCLDLMMTTHHKVEKQQLKITSVHVDKVKTILTYLGLPYIQANGEAETVCCYLAMNGEVDAVLTEDTDVLAYGVPVFLSNYDTKEKTFRMIEIKDVLTHLQLTQSQFLDMCIMCRCDYNKLGITENGEIKPIPVKFTNPKTNKLTNVGPMRAYNLVYQYGGFEDIQNNIEINLDPLNYERCRELLTIPSTIENNKIPFSQPIQPQKIKDFLRENKCYIPFSTIDELWKPTSIKMVECVEEHEDHEEESDEEFYVLE